RRTEVNPFSDKQITLLETFADQAVIAIENVRLFKELQERTQELTRSVEELQALGEVGRAVSGSLDIQSVLTSIVSHAVELSKTDAGTIYEFDESTQAFVPRASYGMTEELIEALRQSHIRVGEGAVGEAARTRAAFQIADLEREPHYALRFLIEAGYRALLAVPLLREDRVIGGLVVRRKAAGDVPAPVRRLLADVRDPVGHRHPERAALPGDRREEPGARRALAQPGAARPPLYGPPGAAVPLGAAHARPRRRAAGGRARSAE